MGCVAQSVAHLTQEPEVPGSVLGSATVSFVSSSDGSRRAVVSYRQKYVHEVLVNRIEGLSLPRKCVVRLTNHPDMTKAVYGGGKTTQQQQVTLTHVCHSDQAIFLSQVTLHCDIMLFGLMTQEWLSAESLEYQYYLQCRQISAIYFFFGSCFKLCSYLMLGSGVTDLTDAD